MALPMEKGSLGNEAFNKFFGFFKKWYSFTVSTEEKWDAMVAEATDLLFSYTEKNQKLIDNVKKELNSDIEPLSILVFFTMQYIEKNQKEGIEVAEFESYKTAFSDMFLFFKKNQELYSYNLDEQIEYERKKRVLLELIETSFNKKDSGFISIFKQCIKQFEEKMELYRKYIISTSIEPLKEAV